MAAENGQVTNYCEDETSWREWHGLIEKHPADDALHALYALRLGLCSMVNSGNITLDRATSIFERMRESIIESQKDRDGLVEKKAEHGI